VTPLAGGDPRPETSTFMSCPQVLRASMITAGEDKAPAVSMDCRDKPGNDTSL
jgi:hypothetical protein